MSCPGVNNHSLNRNKLKTEIVYSYARLHQRQHIIRMVLSLGWHKKVEVSQLTLPLG